MKQEFGHQVFQSNKLWNPLWVENFTEFSNWTHNTWFDPSEWKIKLDVFLF